MAQISPPPFQQPSFSSNHKETFIKTTSMSLLFSYLQITKLAEKQSVNTGREHRIHSSNSTGAGPGPRCWKVTWYNRMAHTSGNRHVQQGITFIYLQKPELHQTAEKP